MATILQIDPSDDKKKIQQKLDAWKVPKKIKSFNASKYTGTIKSFGDPLAYQKKLRDEWQ